MTPDDVLAQPSTLLGQDQRESYFENGYLLLEGVVPDEWVERLLEVTSDFVDQSRSLTKSDAIFDLEPGHSARFAPAQTTYQPGRAARGVLGVRLEVAARRYRSRPRRPEM